MEEFRRFLRYVIPGLIFMIEVLVYFLLFDISFQLKLFETWTQLLGANIAYPLLVFLGSGGFGFLLGIFYHAARFRWPSQFAIDFLPLIKEAAKRGWLELQNHTHVKVDIYSLNTNDAWRIVTSFWYERLCFSKRIKGADLRLIRIVDIIHSLGATVMASSFAFVVCLIILLLKGSEIKFPDIASILPYHIIPIIMIIVMFFAIPFSILLVSWFNFRKAVKDLESLVGIITLNELQDEFSKNKDPTIMNVAEYQLEKIKKKEKVIVMKGTTIFKIVGGATTLLGIILIYLVDIRGMGVESAFRIWYSWSWIPMIKWLIPSIGVTMYIVADIYKLVGKRKLDREMKEKGGEVRKRHFKKPLIFST